MPYDAMLAETLNIHGAHDDLVEAYTARPLDPGPRGGMIVIHHLPGYDRESKEIVRRFAAAGYNAICVNLYSRIEPGASYDDQAAAARAQGGVPDLQVMGDVKGAARWLRALPTSNGKVGTIGFCSGGRQSFLAGCTLDTDATVVCYGGMIVGPPRDGMPASFVPLLDRTAALASPLLGLWGNDDQFPTPEQVDELEAELKKEDKAYEFHRYDGAGHAFMGPDRASYRPEQAVDAWEKVFAFLGRELVA